jgi:hypothetical protein
MDRADSTYTTPAPVSHEAAIERALFARVADEPTFVWHLATLIASHKLVVRLQLLPARTRPPSAWVSSARANLAA